MTDFVACWRKARHALYPLPHTRLLSAHRAVESKAATLPEVIQETLLASTSERQGRAIDHDQSASMEKKKQEGYF